MKDARGVPGPRPKLRPKLDSVLGSMPPQNPGDFVSAGMG